MKRIEILDGLRGYFLIFMLINHLVFEGGYWLVLINHRQIAFVEDAQGFVFLSGLLIGMVHCRKMQRAGFWTGARAIWRRAGELYLYELGILALVLTAAAVLPHAADVWRGWLWDLGWANWRLVLASALLLFQPTYMEILPQYILYLLVAPALIWASLNGHWRAVLIGSGFVWLAAQFGIHRPLTGLWDAALTEATGTGLRAYFNPLAWQAVFFPAMVLGVLTATGRVDWTAIFRPDRTLIPWTALLLCLFFLPLRYSLSHGMMPGAIFAAFSPYESRGDFGLVYLVNFAAAAGGLAWLLIAGPLHRAQWVRAAAAAMHWLFGLSFLRLLGRHSLQVYVWHIVIAYGVRLIDSASPPFSEAAKVAIAVVAILLLALPPLWRERATRAAPGEADGRTGRTAPADATHPRENPGAIAPDP